MKKYISILLAIVSVALISCEPKDNWTPGEPASKDAKTIYFTVSDERGQETNPNDPATEWEIAVARMDTTGEYPAASLKLIVTENTDNVFTVPETVDFEQDEEEAVITVKIGKMNAGETYSLAIKLDMSGLNPYTELQKDLVEAGSSYFYQMSICPIAWSEKKTGVLVDQFMPYYFELPNDAWYVEYQTAELPNGNTRIRLINPYNSADDDAEPDADGIYEGCSFLEPGDVDTENNWNMFFESDPEGKVSFTDYDMGFDFGYGAVYIVWYETSLFGEYDPEKGVFFDPKDQILAIGDDEGVFSYVGVEFYVSKEAYIESNPHAKFEDYLGTWSTIATNTLSGNDTTITWTISENEEAPGSYLINPVGHASKGLKAKFGSEKLHIQTQETDIFEMDGMDYQTVISLLGADGMGSMAGEVVISFNMETGRLEVAADAELVGFNVWAYNVEDEQDETDIIEQYSLAETEWKKVETGKVVRRSKVSYKNLQRKTTHHRF